MKFILKSLAILCVFEGNTFLAQNLHAETESDMQGHSDLSINSTDKKTIVKEIFQKDHLLEQNHQGN